MDQLEYYFAYTLQKFKHASNPEFSHAYIYIHWLFHKEIVAMCITIE